MTPSSLEPLHPAAREMPPPALALGVAAALVLFGLFAWEYVWVYAGQIVPLS